MTQDHALRDQLLRADLAELRRRLVDGRAVDPRALEGFSYRGTSLGLPRVVERLTWQTFQKTFWRHPGSGRLLGWNVRLQQDGLDAPSRPKVTRAGEPRTTWHYQVLRAEEAPLPNGWPRDLRHGLIIDYGRATNQLADTVRFVKDPLVDVGDGSGDVLLGVSVATLLGLVVETPTYFLLERDGPISFVPARARDPGPGVALALLPFERRWAEQLFDAILAVDPSGPHGLPPFAALDHRAFWSALEGHTAPHVAVGLRATVHALNAAPLLMGGLRRPLSALPRADRIACVERLARSSRHALRQMVATAKILACFAYFEHHEVRARLGGSGAPTDREQPCAA